MPVLNSNTRPVLITDNRENDNYSRRAIAIRQDNN